MGLDEIIRDAVKLIDRQTVDLQANVVYSPWIGSNSMTGAPVYGSKQIFMGVVEYRQMLRKTQDGQEIMQQASVIFPRAMKANGADDRREPIDPRDQIVLPNGYTGPIIFVSGVVDPMTEYPYAIEVILG